MCTLIALFGVNPEVPLIVGGSRDFPKANRARGLVAHFGLEPWARLTPKLQGVLGDHDLLLVSEVPEPPAGSRLSRDVLRSLQALRFNAGPYGTTSSTIVGVGEGRVMDYRFAAGPPCVVSFLSIPEARDR